MPTRDPESSPRRSGLFAARCASRGKGLGQRPSPSLSPERKEKRPERLSSGRLRQPSPRTAKLPAHPMSVWPCCKCHFRNVGLTNEYHGSCAEVTPFAESLSAICLKARGKTHQ